MDQGNIPNVQTPGVAGGPIPPPPPPPITPTALMALLAEVLQSQVNTNDSVNALTGNVSNVNILVNNLTTQINTLTANVQRMTARQAGNTPKSPVEKPSLFKGKENDSESSRMFRSAMWVYIMNNRGMFALRDAQGAVTTDAQGAWLLNLDTAVASALSLMTEDAAVWARPHMEELATGRNPFPSWPAFMEAFQGKFEPVDAVTEAKAKLQSVKQGKRTFSQMLADFETWAPRTGWTKADLFDRLKDCLNEEYRTRLSYFEVPARNYDALIEKCRIIDRSLLELSTQKSKKSTSSSGTQPSAFQQSDPNAMEIDAIQFDSLFKGIQGNPTAIRQRYQEFIKGKCTVCGSSRHTNAPGRHEETTCNHCGRKGHWSTICLSRVAGSPRATPRPQKVNVTSTTSTPDTTSTSTPPSASISAVDTEENESEISILRRMVEAQQKTLDSLSTSINANF